MSRVFFQVHIKQIEKLKKLSRYEQNSKKTEEIEIFQKYRNIVKLFKNCIYMECTFFVFQDAIKLKFKSFFPDACQTITRKTENC